MDMESTPLLINPNEHQDFNNSKIIEDRIAYMVRNKKRYPKSSDTIQGKLDRFNVSRIDFVSAGFSKLQ